MGQHSAYKPHRWSGYLVTLGIIVLMAGLLLAVTVALA